MTRMKLLALFAATLACTVAAIPQTRSGEAKTFKGEIGDTQCALNVHSLSQSHKEMIGMKPELKTNADCARFCVKERGGRYVLQTKDKVYKLNSEFAAEEWAGEKVKIVGILDPKTNVITVESTESLAAAVPGKPAPPKN